MTRSFLRQYNVCRFFGLTLIVASITYMGLLTVQRNQCTEIVLPDSLIKSLHGANKLSLEQRLSDTHRFQTNYSYRTDVRNADDSNSDAKSSVSVYSSYWFRNMTSLNIDTAKSSYLFFSHELLVQNVSKFEQDWFHVIEDENYLQNNTDLFTQNKNVKNNLDNNFIIKGDKICAEDGPFLLIIIPSVASNTAIRDTIRWTWLRAAETNSWPRTFIKEKIKHIFVFGLTENHKTENYKELIDESNIFGDIVIANFVDTYRNLTRKVLAGLNWARLYCKNAQFVLKADEDTFINVPLMIKVLYHVSERETNGTFVMGLQHTADQPRVVRDGRWAVSVQEYPLDSYPQYVYGHTYVISRKAVVYLTDAAYHVPLISPEDAFITGILPKVAKVKRITAASFTVCCRYIYDCEVVWNQRVALPEVKSSKSLVTLWSNVITHSCNNTLEFL